MIDLSNNLVGFPIKTFSQELNLDWVAENGIAMIQFLFSWQNDNWAASASDSRAARRRENWANF